MHNRAGHSQMTNDQEPTRPPHRRVRSLRFVATVVLLALLSPIAAFIIWGRIEAARLDRALDALEARHEPLDIADFETKPATDAQREASHTYARATRLAGDRPLTSAQLEEAARRIEGLCSPTSDSPRPEQMAALHALEDPFTPALDLLDRATSMDVAGWDDADRPRRLSMEELRARNLARLNAIRIARLACADRNADAAARALLATIRLQRVVPPAFFASTGMRTVHGLQSLLTFTAPDPSLLQTLQLEYETQIDERAIATSVRQQRAQWLYFALPGVLSDPPPGDAPAPINPFAAIVMRLARPLRDRGLVNELREFDEALAAASQPWPARLDAAIAITNRYRHLGSQSRRVGFARALSQSFNPHRAGVNLESAVMRAAETLANTRASAGAIAVARYRRAHGGELPASLHDLVPQYLSGPLIDPYTGTELKYQRNSTSYKVYSVGINRGDDGGTWDQHSDLQASRRGNPLDVGVAVAPLASHDR
jgi:hypothetical protein